MHRIAHLKKCVHVNLMCRKPCKENMAVELLDWLLGEFETKSVQLMNRINLKDLLENKF